MSADEGRRARLDRVSTQLAQRASYSDAMALVALSLMVLAALGGAYFGLSTWTAESRTARNLASVEKSYIALRKDQKLLIYNLGQMHEKIGVFKYHSSQTSADPATQAEHRKAASAALDWAEQMSSSYVSSPDFEDPMIVDTDWATFWVRIGVGLFTLFVVRMFLVVYQYNRQAGVTLASRAIAFAAVDESGPDFDQLVASMLHSQTFWDDGKLGKALSDIAKGLKDRSSERRQTGQVQ